MYLQICDTNTSIKGHCKSLRTYPDYLAHPSSAAHLDLPISKIPQSLTLRKNLKAATKMLKGSLTLVFLAFFLLPESACAPVEAIQLGSKHTLYLTTCTRQSIIPDCPLIILCARQQRSSYKAVAYYANGPIESNRNTYPTQMTTVSQNGEPWEGEQRTASIGRVGQFSSTIDTSGGSLKKGEIAGLAKLGEEEFVCFRNGVTSIPVRDGFDLDLLGRTVCTADYWCPSIQM